MSSPAPGEAEVEVVIPTHDGAERLRRALASLAAQTAPATVRVVVNGSRDGTSRMLAGEHPQVDVLELPQNVGFGAAINRAAERSKAGLLILMNDDAEADSSFVERMTAAWRGSGAEMVAGCMRTPAGRVETLGIIVDRALNAYDAGFGSPYPPPRDAAPPILGPSGGAAGYAREAFARAGGFDETLFAYLEDVDLAIRMQLAGMRCVSVPDAFVWHAHSATLGAGSARKNELLGFAREYLLWKHGAGMSIAERARARALDLVVYSGKLAIDRDAGAARGAWRARRHVRRRPRPPANPALPGLLADMGLGEQLSRRLARRR